MKRHLRDTQKKLLALIIEKNQTGTDVFTAAAFSRSAMNHLKDQKLIETRDDTGKLHATCAGIESFNTGMYQHAGQKLRIPKAKPAATGVRNFGSLGGKSA